MAPVIDARRGEVFAAAYRVGADSALEEVLAPAALRPAALASGLSRLARDGGPAWLGGNGVTAAGAELRGPLLRSLPAGAARVRAANLVRRVAAGAGRPAVPTYLRLPDAELNRRRALARACAA